MDINRLPKWFATYKETSLHGRYIHTKHIAPLLDTLSDSVQVTRIGESENNLPIHVIKLGTGTRKMVLWSQMHGNESTTTKAIFDTINFLTTSDDNIAKDILVKCTLYIIPILNPDGAFAYTRLNYNQVDLNRDAQEKTQKESIILRNLIDHIQPDYAFNLHGQRTIFSVGETDRSATVSFLSPAGDTLRSVTQSRKIAMDIIAEMNTVLQHYIPNQVGRYDDGFNIHCVGDTLEQLGIPTLLFEAGHYTNDYDREITREYIFYALLTGVSCVAQKEDIGVGYKEYFLIPENGKCFYDIIIRDVTLKSKNVDIAIQYTEKLRDNIVKFIPVIVKIGNLQHFYGHQEIIGEKRRIRSYNDIVEVVPDVELLKFHLDSELFSIESIKN